MKNRIAIILLVLLMLPLPLISSMVSYGSNGETNSITIIKYRIPEGVVLPEQPIGDMELNLSLVTENEPIQRMPGVTYRVVRMELVAGEYLPMTGSFAMTMDIVTNENGIATTGALPDGIFRVIEMPHELIPTGEPAVMIHLPIMTEDGAMIRDVMVYPKSNVITSRPPIEGGPCDCEECHCEVCGCADCDCGGCGCEVCGCADCDCGVYGCEVCDSVDCDCEYCECDLGERPPEGAPGRLPQTSGNISSLVYLLLMAGGIALLGIFGICLVKKKGVR